MLLGFLHSSQPTDLKLKSDVLSLLLHIFDINPQTRSVFQEVGGFVYVVSVLVSLEGSLTNPPTTLVSVAREGKSHKSIMNFAICSSHQLVGLIDQSTNPMKSKSLFFLWFLLVRLSKKSLL